MHPELLHISVAQRVMRGSNSLPLSLSLSLSPSSLSHVLSHELHMGFGRAWLCQVSRPTKEIVLDSKTLPSTAVEVQNICNNATACRSPTHNARLMHLRVVCNTIALFELPGELCESLTPHGNMQMKSSLRVAFFDSGKS